MLVHSGSGRFIVIEGLDGAGSTTQVRLLAERLRETREVYVTHEPSEGPAGLQIRVVLLRRVQMDPAALAALFAADRMDHLTHRDGAGGIVPHLEAGVDVLTDRYYLSSLAYQGMNLDWDWLWAMHHYCIRPDLTVFVDVPVEVCLERMARGRGSHQDLFENRRALTRAREAYQRAIDRLRAQGERIEVLDGDRSPEEVREAIWAVVGGL